MATTVTDRLRALADDDLDGSLSQRLRERRFARFEALVSRMHGPVRIIDLGGTSELWEQAGWVDRPGVTVTLVNIVEQERRHENLIPLVGDATDLADVADRSFDIAFSNSVIEHLFTYENQLAMANEVRRVAQAYCVQTPNFWFPMEPHFLVPGWHWLPEAVRVSILRRRPVGWMGRCEDRDLARQAVREVRLLTRREMRRLFPDAALVPERFGGLIKSWTAIGGFPAR